MEVGKKLSAKPSLIPVPKRGKAAAKRTLDFTNLTTTLASGSVDDDTIFVSDDTPSPENVAIAPKPTRLIRADHTTSPSVKKFRVTDYSQLTDQTSHFEIVSRFLLGDKKQVVLVYTDIIKQYTVQIGKYEVDKSSDTEFKWILGQYIELSLSETKRLENIVLPSIEAIASSAVVLKSPISFTRGFYVSYRPVERAFDIRNYFGEKSSLRAGKPGSYMSIFKLAALKKIIGQIFDELPDGLGDEYICSHSNQAEECDFCLPLSTGAGDENIQLDAL